MGPHKPKYSTPFKSSPLETASLDQEQKAKLLAKAEAQYKRETGQQPNFNAPPYVAQEGLPTISYNEKPPVSDELSNSLKCYASCMKNNYSFVHALIRNHNKRDHLSVIVISKDRD